MGDFWIKKGDRAPSLEAILKTSDGPLDLTGCTVRLRMRSRRIATGAPKVDAACTVVDPLAGHVRYDWASADVDTVGVFYAEFEVTRSDTKKLVVPNNKLGISVVVTDTLT